MRSLAVTYVLILIVFMQACGRKAPPAAEQISRDFSAANQQWMGANSVDAEAWNRYIAIVKTPSEVWQESLALAGGESAKPKDWPAGYEWPYDCQDALRAGAPDVVVARASDAIRQLDNAGFFERLSALSAGAPPVRVHNAESGMLFAARLDDIGPARNVARHLFLRMRISLESGDEASFLQDASNAQWLAHTLAQDMYFGGRVCCAIDAFLAREVQLAVVEHDLSSNTLARLDALLARMDPRGELEFALQQEHRMHADLLARCYVDNGRGDGRLRPEKELFETLSKTLATPIDPNDKALATRENTRHAFDHLASESMRQLRLECAADVIQKFEDFNGLYPDARYPIVGIVKQPVSQSIELAFFAETERNAARIVVALARCRAERKRDSKTLSELVPQFLEGVPPDRLSGQPWRYETIEGTQPGYVLYSIGIDQTDNHAIHGRMPTLWKRDGGVDYVVSRPRDP